MTTRGAKSLRRSFARWPTAAAVGALLALLAPAAMGGEQVEVALLDGSRLNGAITAWDAHGLTLATADGERRIEVDQLLDVARAKEPAAGPDRLLIEIVDGTRLSCTQFLVAGGKATLTGGLFKLAAPLPRDSLKTVALRPDAPGLAEVLNEIARKELAGDCLVVLKRDGESLDYLAGVLGTVTDEEVAFTWEGDTTPVKRTKIAAMTYYQASRPALAAALCRLTLSDESEIAVRELVLKDGRLSLSTPAGASMTVSLEDVVRADFSSGKIVYLSDLEPAAVQWTPRVASPPGAELLARAGLPRQDQSYGGSPLALRWKDDASPSRRDVRRYAKGLALRSRTELSYRIPAGMRRLKVLAGIDPETAQQGHVTLRIAGDDQVLWEGEIDGRQSPQEIDVELLAARRLHVVVDYGQNLDYGDRLHLAEARFTK